MKKLLIIILALGTLNSFAKVEMDTIEKLGDRVQAAAVDANQLRALYDVSSKRVNKKRSNQFCATLSEALITAGFVKLMVNREADQYQQVTVDRVNKVFTNLNESKWVCNRNHKRNGKFRRFLKQEAREVEILIYSSDGADDAAEKLVDTYQELEL